MTISWTLAATGSLGSILYPVPSKDFPPPGHFCSETLGSFLQLHQTSDSLPPYGQWLHLLAKPKAAHYLFLCFPHTQWDGWRQPLVGSTQHLAHPLSSPFCPFIPSLLFSSLSGQSFLRKCDSATPP